jgi:NADH-quinone oxidoreductase subunit L
MHATGVSSAAWLLLAFPLAGAVFLLLGGKRLNSWGHLVGVAMPILAFCYGVVAFFNMLTYPAGAARSRDLHIYQWIDVGHFNISLGLLLDPLSICFVLLITGVGSLIHIFAVGYMANDPDRRRFFGYMNLFLAAMLLLVLADNYLALYAGWEGVGLASYLLIGFWYYKDSAAVAAKKAFIANRVGDVGLSLAIMLMFLTFGTVTSPACSARPTRPATTWSPPSACCCSWAPVASPLSCRCSPGCWTPWRAPPRSRR